MPSDAWPQDQDHWWSNTVCTVGTTILKHQDSLSRHNFRTPLQNRKEYCRSCECKAYFQDLFLVSVEVKNISQIMLETWLATEKLGGAWGQGYVCVWDCMENVTPSCRLQTHTYVEREVCIIYVCAHVLLCTCVCVCFQRISYMTWHDMTWPQLRCIQQCISCTPIKCHVTIMCVCVLIQ